MTTACGDEPSPIPDMVIHFYYGLVPADFNGRTSKTHKQVLDPETQRYVWVRRAAR